MSPRVLLKYSIGNFVSLFLYIFLQASPVSAFTLCTITINSSDEKEAFVAQFPEAEVVELTTLGNESNWFEKSCQSQVRCDVLLISGHFASEFFGDTPFKLTLNEMEQRACEAQCPGLLQHPAAVFLFGCNTLAGKQPDRRTPLEYQRVLMQDGFSLEDAQRVTAFRYSPFGEDTYRRLHRIFYGPGLIFGFYSTAPIGPQAASFFTPILKQVQRGAPQVFEQLGQDVLLRERAMSMWNSGMPFGAVIEGGGGFSERECLFHSKHRTQLDKLRAAEAYLKENPLQSVVSIADFVNKIEKLEPEEKEVLSRMRANSYAETEVVSSLRFVTDLHDLYFSLLKFAKSVGWFSDSVYEDLKKRRLISMLNDGVTVDERDFLCGAEIEFQPPQEVYGRNPNSVNFIEALACLNARDLQTQGFLRTQARHGSSAVKVAALDAMSELELCVPADIPYLVSLLNNQNYSLRENAVFALGSLQPLDAQTLEQLAQLYLDRDASLAWPVSDVLKRSPRIPNSVYAIMARALSEIQDKYDRHAIAQALVQNPPKEAAVLKLFEVFRSDADEIVRALMSQLFSSR